jgi:anti-sigma regulatory factor (Ser/Thr protein kinase)
VDEEDLTLVVEDDGRPFDPLRDAPCPDLDSPLELRREGGLGLHLVRHMADETVYERVGQANRVRMRVDLRPTA